MQDSAVPAKWPRGPGEMARRIREYDWASTSLGPITVWPPCLRAAVDICLGSAVPSYVWWGPDLIQLYNDAALAINRAKHPAFLGQPAREAWADVWEEIGEKLEHVATTGEPVRGDNLPMVPDRDESRETAWFTFSYGPVHDETGAVAGIFCSAIETTDNVRAHQSLRASEERQTFLLQLSDALRAEPDADHVAFRALQLLSRHLGLDRCYVGVYRLADDRAEFPHQVGNDRVPPLPDAVRLSDFPGALRVALGRTLVLDDVAGADSLTDADRRNLGALGLGALVAASLRRGEGAPIWSIVAVSARPRRWTPGEVALLEEATERTWAAVERARAEVALQERERERELRLIIDNIPALIGFIDRDLRYRFVNEEMARFVGRTVTDFGDLTLPEVVGERVYERLRPGIETVLSGTAVQFDDAEPDKYGPGRHGVTEEHYIPRVGDDGVVEGYYFLAVDVSERRRVEAELRMSEERYRTLVQNIVDYAIFMLDADGRVTKWTVGAQRVKGYTPEEVIGQHVSMFYPPDELLKRDPTQELAEAATTGRAEREGWRLAKGGVRFWGNEIMTAIRDDAGQLIGFTKITRDLTERRQAEEALRENEERFRVIVETATDYAILSANADGIIDGWYPGAESTFGWSATEAIGKPMEMTYLQEDQDAGVPAQEREIAREHGAAPNVRWHRRRDGSRVFIDGIARARYAADGQFLGVFKIGQDVTDRRLAQQQRQAHDERVRQDLTERVEAATAELRALSRRLLLVQEEERRHLALELHDDFGQMLTGLGLIVGNGSLDAARLAEARRIVADLTVRVRHRSMELRPATLDSHGLLPTLRWHLERYQRQTGITVDLLEEGADRRFDSAVEVAVYRIVQEALTNAARHAGSNHAVVQLYADDVALTASIRDHGRGFDRASSSPGSGLGGIRERAELLGGTLEIDARPGDGVVLTVEIPLNVPAATNHDQPEEAT